MGKRRWIVAAVLVGAASAAVVFLRRDPAPSAAEQALGRVLPEVRFEHTPLEEAIATLARQVGAPITLDRPALQAAGVDPAGPVDLRLRNLTLDRVLTHLLAYASSTTSHPLVHTVFRGGIVVTSAGNVEQYAYARVYDVRDVVVVELPEEVRPPRDIQSCFGTWHDDGLPMTRQEQDETVLSLISDVALPDVWDSRGMPNPAHPLHGRLLVVTSWHAHRRIECLLHQLRDPVPAGAR